MNAAAAEPIEIGRLTAKDRAFIVIPTLAFLGAMVWCIHVERGWWRGETIVFSAVGLDSLVFSLRLPRLLARADDSGIDYVDMRNAWRFVYVRRRAAWADVVAIDTRVHWSMSPVWGVHSDPLRAFTRVTVRREGGLARITCDSDEPDYSRWLAALRAHAAGAELRGLGADGARAERELAVAQPSFTRRYRWLIGLGFGALYFAWTVWTRR